MCTFFLFSTQLLVLSTSLCVLAPLPDSFFTRCARTRCVYLRSFILYFVSFICNEYTYHPAWCAWLRFPSTPPSLPPTCPARPTRNGKCCCCAGRRFLQSNAMQLHLHTPSWEYRRRCPPRHRASSHQQHVLAKGSLESVVCL